MTMLDPMFVFRDRFAQPGDAPIELADMVPQGFVAPASWAIASGNEAGHFALAGSSLDYSAAGAAADMPAGTYTLVIEATWSVFAAAHAKHSATLTVECPAHTRYVDPQAGSDAADGLTKATAWRHAPGQIAGGAPAATGLAAAFVPAGPTLINIRGGSMVRGALVPTRDGLVYASSLWGGRATFTGSVPLPASTPASAADVFGNPAVANIRRFDLGIAWKRGQYLLDNGALVLPAQWPAAGADPLLDSQDPTRHLAGGMFRCPAAEITGGGTANTVATGSVAAAILAEFGTRSLVGYTVWQWVSPNEIAPFIIAGHDVATGRITYDTRGYVISASGGVSALQIVGHPWSIKAPGQFAGRRDDTAIVAWLASGAAPEIITLRCGLRADAVATLGVYGIDFQAYCNDAGSGSPAEVTAAGVEGSGIGTSRATNFTHRIARVGIRWLINDSVKSGAIRTLGNGYAMGHVLDRNHIHDCVRASGIRYSTLATDGAQVIRNLVERITRTGCYIVNMTRARVRANRLRLIRSTHGNGFTFYVEAIGGNPFISDANEVIFNQTDEVIRPCTKDAHFNSNFSNNWFETDSAVADHVRIYASSASELYDRNVFIRSRNGAVAGTLGLSVGTDPGIFRRSIIDGVTGGPLNGDNSACAATVTDCRIIRAAAGSGLDDTVVAGTDDRIGKAGSGNVYAPIAGFDGTLTPEMRTTLGLGRVGYATFIHSLASVSFPALASQSVAAPVMSAWRQVTTADATRPVTVTGGEFREADDAAGANATGWASAGTYHQGKYLQLRLTTPATYDTPASCTLDLGADNRSSFAVRTAKAKDVPWITLDTSDTFNAASSSLGGDSQVATIALKIRLAALPAAVSTIFGTVTGSLVAAVQLVPTGVLRITLRNAAGVVVLTTNTPALAIGTDYDIQLTADMTRPDAASGLRCYMNGAPVALSTTTFTAGSTFGWSTAATYRFGNSVLSADVGYLYLSTRWVDLASADTRERFMIGRRLGPNGANVDGSAPAVLLLGTKAQFEDPAGINRGSGPKFVRQGSTAVAPVTGTAAAWPLYTYATGLTVTAPASIELGATVEITVAANGVLANDLAFTLNAGGQVLAGTLANGEAPQAVLAYTPSTAGQKAITVSANGLAAGETAMAVTTPVVEPSVYEITITVADTASGATALLVVPLLVA